MKRKLNFAHLDAAENIFFERELEQVRAKSYDVKYPALKARTLIPVNNETDPGAETVRYEQYDSVGVAKIIASYANDLPRADVVAKEFRAPIKSLGMSFGYSIQDIRAARMAGKPLETRKANAARKAVEEKIDAIAAFGDELTGLLGLLNQPNVGNFAVPAGEKGGTEWANKTPDEILKDMNGITNGIVVDTHGVEEPDTLLLPLDQYGIIATTPRSPNSDTTILEFFLKSNPHIRNVEPWHKLAGAGAGGTDRMVCYRRDPDALELNIPQEFEQFPPQAKGLEFEIPCHARTGGVLMFYPLSASYGDGI